MTRANAVLDATLLSLKSDREMQSDLARLGKACCEPQRFVSLAGSASSGGVGGTALRRDDCAKERWRVFGL